MDIWRFVSHFAQHAAFLEILIINGRPHFHNIIFLHVRGLAVGQEVVVLPPLSTRNMTALYPLNLRIFAKNSHVTACTLFRILGIYKQFIILWVACVDVVEHQLKGFVIRLITAHVQIVVVEVATARLVNISDVRRLVAAVQLVRMLRV